LLLCQVWIVYEVVLLDPAIQMLGSEQQSVYQILHVCEGKKAVATTDYQAQASAFDAQQ